MATTLKARQGTLFKYEFAAFNPLPSSRNPDLDNPYDFTGYGARFSIQTPTPIVFTEPPNIEVQPFPGKVSVFVPATITATWSQGSLPYEIEMIPSEGEEYAFALIHGTISMEKQSA